MNNSSIHDRFFFARNEAEYYDATIELAVPQYKLVFQVLIEVLEAHFRKQISQDSTDVKGIFLDVGAGTGAEGLPILRRFRGLNMLAVDLSEEMRDQFINNLTKHLGKDQLHRIHYIVEDILNVQPENNCVAAVSAYCIHHFSIPDKKRVYQRMFDFLKPGGILVNVDLFNFESRSVSEAAHCFDIEYIEKQFDSPDSVFNDALTVPEHVRKELKEQWIYHMNHDNELHSVDIQLAQLREIGFEDVECIFRYWQQGVIRATKPL